MEFTSEEQRKERLRFNKVPEQIGSNEECQNCVTNLYYGPAPEWSPEPIATDFYLHRPGQPFGDIVQGCLRTGPAAPDPPENQGDQEKAENQSQANEQHQIEFFYPQDLTEKIEAQFRDIDAEE
jgi:hypothetical protein